MTDTDRLAALLHETGLQCITDASQASDMIYHRAAAKKLIAAGVTLAPTPPDAPDVRGDVRWAFLDPDTGEWIEVKPGVVTVNDEWTEIDEPEVPSGGPD